MSDMKMLHDLVKKGESLEKEFTKDDYPIKTTKNIVKLSEWINEVIFWLEKKKPNSEVTKTVIEESKDIQNSNLHYSAYQNALGSLKALIKSENH